MLYDVEVRLPDRARRSTGWSNDTVTSDEAFAIRRAAEIRRARQLVRVVDATGRVVSSS